jgi:hypothetical protein
LRLTVDGRPPPAEDTGVFKAIRTLLFCLLTLGLLGLLTYLIQYSPSQVTDRASAALEEIVLLPPVIAGARESWWGPLTIERIEIPSSPVLERKQVLLLDGIVVEGRSPSSWWGRDQGARSGLDIRAERAQLFLDKEVGRDASGSTISSWNFQGVAPTGRLWEAGRGIARGRHRIEVGELAVELEEIRKPEAERNSWTFRAEDLSIEGCRDGEILVRGSIAPSPFWNEGSFSLQIQPAAEGVPILEAKGNLDGLKGLDEWVTLLIPAYGKLLGALAPTGPVTFTVSSLRLTPAAPPDGGGGRTSTIETRCSFRHYDGTFRLPPWGVEVRHVSGSLSAEGGALTFGGGGDARVSGEIWGADVELSGKIEPAEASVSVHLPRTDMRTPPLTALPPPLAALWKRLRPVGTLQGDVRYRIAGDPIPRWGGFLEFQGLAFGELDALLPAAVKVTLRHEGGAGSAAIEFFDGRLDPFGDLRGEIAASWTDAGIKVKLDGLSAGGGGISGEIGWLFGEKTASGQVRIDRARLDYAGGLLSASRASGKLSFIVGGEKGVSGKCEIDLEDLTLRGDLAEAWAAREGLPFSEGQVELTPGADRVPVKMALRGDRCGLRFSGSIGYRGDLDGVGLVAVGEPARGLNLVGLAGDPIEWRRSVKDGGIPFRAGGHALRPRLRRVDWSDPAFGGRAGETPPVPEGGTAAPGAGSAGPR